MKEGREAVLPGPSGFPPEPFLLSLAACGGQCACAPLVFAVLLIPKVAAAVLASNTGV